MPARSLLVLPSLFALTLGGWSQTAQTAPDRLALFVLIGQSNMAGRGKVTAQDTETNPRIFMLTKDLEWAPAKDPVHFDKPVAGVELCSQFARVQKKPVILCGMTGVYCLALLLGGAD